MGTAASSAPLQSAFPFPCSPPSRCERAPPPRALLAPGRPCLDPVSPVPTAATSPDHAQMPRRAHHEPAPPACCCYGCDGGGCAPAPAPCCCPAPVPAPCYYPAPVPVPAPCYYPAPAPVPAPSSSTTTDHLLHAIAAHLLLGSSATASAPTPAPAPAPPAQSQPPPPPPAPGANPYPYPHHYQYQYQQQEAKAHAYAHPPPAQHHPQPDASGHGHLLLHSLLRRVAALESALPRRPPHPAPVRRAPNPNPPPRRVVHQQLVEDDDDDHKGDEDSDSDSDSTPLSPPPRLHRRPPRRASPRELAAARTIQAHFRRFLARRSRTLRQLKELAVLRSKAAALRGALSGRRGSPDPAAVSEAAMSLLLQLDAIQGGDPMIREGRRAVSRELTRILEFVDKVLVKEHGQLSMGNALDSGDYHEGCSAEFVANRPAVNKKKVSFSGKGQTQFIEETDNVKEVDEEYESSGSAESDEMKGMPAKRSANGKLGLAAPTPAHMESRRVAGEKR